jgi:hypothetical protein
MQTRMKAMLACLLFGCAAHATQPETTSVRVVTQQRGLFDTVRKKPDLKRICDGHDGLLLATERTPGDVVAAIFTAFLYTPAHVRVQCR